MCTHRVHTMITLPPPPMVGPSSTQSFHGLYHRTHASGAAREMRCQTFRVVSRRVKAEIGKPQKVQVYMYIHILCVCAQGRKTCQAKRRAHCYFGFLAARLYTAAYITRYLIDRPGAAHSTRGRWPQSFQTRPAVARQWWDMLEGL